MTAPPEHRTVYHTGDDFGGAFFRGAALKILETECGV